MNTEDQAGALSGEAPQGGPLAGLAEHLWPALRVLAVLTFLTGVLFPQVLATLAWLVFPHQASGSLIVQDGEVVGAELIGQGFSHPGYFTGRPSAAGDGYDAATSGGTNLGPNNPKFEEEVRRRAEEYRRRNKLALGAPVPADAVTCSGSGLDPHISPANAELQVPRVAGERGLSKGEVRRLVARYTYGRQLWCLGEARVAVLPLNRALDDVAPNSRR